MGLTASQLLEAGDLNSAVAHVSEELRTSPGDNGKRTFLFELLCCTGDLDRAAKHLDVLAAESADRAIAVQTYRNLLQGERQRRGLFTDGLLPGLPRSAPDYARMHLDAISRVREDRFEDARALVEEAASTRPAVSGRINGIHFDELTDADDLLGPFLEIIVSGNYSWLPWEVIRSVTIQAPRHLRDLIWLPAEIELDLGALGGAFLPVLYAGSYLHQDDRVKLGRMTDWRSDVPGLALAAGQKLLTADEQDWPLLEVRLLEIEHPGDEHGDTSDRN
jgi:type VI secretion system protein ImpE